MVHFCCVPACSSNSNREKHLSFFSLPLKKKSLLKQWIHAIGRKNLPVNSHTRICSRHFLDANKRQLRPDEVPSQQLPRFQGVKPTRRPPKERILPAISVSFVEEPTTKEIEVQTDVSGIGSCGDSELEVLKKEVKVLPY